MATEQRFVGPVLTYVVYTIVMAIMYAICGYVVGWLGGTIIHATLVGVVLGYWIWKWTMQFVVTTTLRALSAERTTTGSVE